MKKLLSVMLILVLFAAVFSGCTPKTDDANATPTPEVQGDFKNLKPNYQSSRDEDGVWTDVISFNVFNTSDYQTRWSDYAKEWMLENYHIKIGYSVPAASGFSDTWAVCQNKMMENPANRDDYKQKLIALFLAEKTRPDYLPSVYASCTGVEAAWFDLEEYLVDLAPHLKEGGTLYSTYVEWLWGDEKEYWEQMKVSLANDLGEIYAIPRREKMPVQFYLGYSKKSLEQLGVSWDEKPTTWNAFVELLKRYKNLDDESAFSDEDTRVAFRTTNENGNDLIQFVATTYGLDFNSDFSWTTKNGEPLWTYYWDEYLKILKDVNTLAAEGLVCTNIENEKSIANYTLDVTETTYKYSTEGMNEAGAHSGIAGYARDDKFAWWSSDPRNPMYWTTSDTWITQDGYTYSMVGGTQFDANYLAIGNRLGDEFTARIMAFWNYSLSDEGYYSYQFGREGFPFADSLEEAGCYILDEDGKVIYTNHENRFSFTKDGAEENHYWWSKRSADWWTSKNKHYQVYIDNYSQSYENVKAGDGDTLAKKLGFTDTKVFENSWDTMLFGTWFLSDVTAYPMEKTAYWPDESMSKARPNIEKIIGTATENNTICYTGFFKTTQQILGRNAVDMEKKISNLQTIAKTYTVDFLLGKQTEAGWTNYIKNLQDAGYDDVYDYYSRALQNCVTSYKDTVDSQSKVNEARKNA